MASKRVPTSTQDTSSLWHCCDQAFSEPSSIHKHVSNVHANEIDELTGAALDQMLKQFNADGSIDDPYDCQSKDTSCWMPDTSHLSEDKLSK